MEESPKIEQRKFQQIQFDEDWQIVLRHGLDPVAELGKRATTRRLPSIVNRFRC
jgi:hypothetical protein